MHRGRRSKPDTSRNRPKGSASRRWANVPDRQVSGTNDVGLKVERAPRGHRKVERAVAVRRKGEASGRGVSGGQTFITGKRRAGGELVGKRLKPPVTRKRA